MKKHAWFSVKMFGNGIGTIRTTRTSTIGCVYTLVETGKQVLTTAITDDFDSSFYKWDDMIYLGEVFPDSAKGVFTLNDVSAFDLETGQQK